MSTHLSAWALKLFNAENAAPIWSAVATPTNSAYINMAAAVIITLSLVFFLRRLGSGRIICALFPISLFCVPQFLNEFLFFSPVPVTLALIALSLTVLTPRKLDPSEIPDDDGLDGPAGRVFVRTFRFLVSGALAALATWEGNSGPLLAIAVLVVACLSKVRQPNSAPFAFCSWAVGYAAVYATYCFTFSLFHPEFGRIGLSPAALGVFLLIGIAPLIFLLRINPIREHYIAWAFVLVVVCGWNIFSLVCGEPRNPGELFARAVLAQRGDRKIIVMDGFFDNFFKALRTEGVELLDTHKNADRERLLLLADSGAVIKDTALVVKLFYNLPEMEKAATEVGLFRTSDVFLTKKAPHSKKQLIERLTLESKPLFRALEIIEKNIAPTCQVRDTFALRQAAADVRETLKKGIFRGSRVSNDLLMADIVLGDRQAIESDALTILIFDRNDSAANGALGAIRQEEGRFKLAEKYLRAGAAGGGALPMGKLAILLIQTGRFEEAVEWAQKAIAKSPDDLSLHEPLVAALIESGKLDEAQKELDTLDALINDRRSNSASRLFVAKARERLNKLRNK